MLISRGGWEKRAGLGRRSHLELKQRSHLELNGVGRQGDDEWKCDEQKAQHDLEALGFGAFRSSRVWCLVVAGCSLRRKAGRRVARDESRDVDRRRAALGGHARVLMAARASFSGLGMTLKR